MADALVAIRARMCLLAVSGSMTLCAIKMFSMCCMMRIISWYVMVLFMVPLARRAQWMNGIIGARGFLRRVRWSRRFQRRNLKLLGNRRFPRRQFLLLLIVRLWLELAIPEESLIQRTSLSDWTKKSMSYWRSLLSSTQEKTCRG